MNKVIFYLLVSWCFLGGTCLVACERPAISREVPYAQLRERYCLYVIKLDKLMRQYEKHLKSKDRCHTAEFTLLKAANASFYNYLDVIKKLCDVDDPDGPGIFDIYKQMAQDEFMGRLTPEQRDRWKRDVTQKDSYIKPTLLETLVLNHQGIQSSELNAADEHYQEIWDAVGIPTRLQKPYLRSPYRFL